MDLGSGYRTRAEIRYWIPYPGSRYDTGPACGTVPLRRLGYDNPGTVQCGTSTSTVSVAALVVWALEGRLGCNERSRGFQRMPAVLIGRKFPKRPD